jgi:hypothetical protein
MPYSFRKGLLKVLGKQKEKHLAAGNELTSSAATNTREPPTTIRDGNPAAPTSAIDHPHNDPNTPRNNRNQVEDNLTPSEVTANQTTSKDDGAGAHGMYIFVDKPNTESRNVDIVALHGLNGHYSDTWTTTTAEGKRVNWLKELLPDIIPNARIMSFGYNSSVQFSKSTADISNFAEGLLAELMSWRTSEKEKARPIIFVCHSLGGIVFKQVRYIPFHTLILHHCDYY